MHATCATLGASSYRSRSRLVTFVWEGNELPTASMAAFGRPGRGSQGDGADAAAPRDDVATSRYPPSC